MSRKGNSPDNGMMESFFGILKSEMFYVDAAGLPLLGIVPEDPQVMLCANQGQPLILRASRGAAVAYLNIAKRLLGQKAPLMKMR